MEKIQVQKLQKYIEVNFEEKVIPSLTDFIKIDNLSRTFDREWNTNGKLEKAALHVKNWIDQLRIKGTSCEIIKDKGYAPLIFTQIKGDLPQTLFFYGHYDKQPPFTGWMEELGPTDPKIINGKLYGRGGADDGYATYSTMLALKAIQEQQIPLPRCVMITQGDQQSGSGHMPHYLQKLQQRIGNPLMFFCLDSGCLDYERLWLTTSLRGNMVTTMVVKTCEQTLHSGTYSGVVPSVFRIVRMLMNRLENFQTGEINQNFFVDIPSNRYRQMEQTARLFGDAVYNQFPFWQGTQPITKNPLQCLIQRNWHPSVTMTGQTGFPPVQTAANVLLPQIQVRFSIRIPPTLPADKALEKMKEILTTDVPYGAKVDIINSRAASGWNGADYQPYFQNAIKQASDIFFKNSMCSFGMGGAIPLMGMLQKIWPDRPFMIAGVLGPLSNAHGPNQFLHIDYCKKLTCCLAYIVSKCSQHHSKDKQ